MELKNIVASIASQADDFLDSTATRKEVRAAIAGRIALAHPGLSMNDREKAADAVMEILIREDFFESGRDGNSWDEGSEDGEEE